MYSFGQLQELIGEALAEKTLPQEPSELYEPIGYMMNLGGKRVRPALVLMGCNLFTEKIEAAIRPALAVEFFHNFTLIHDDIMDRAPLRRGAATVHTKWGLNTALLSGDVMLVEAYKLIAGAGAACLEEMLEVFSRTAVQVCEGQQIDMNFEREESVTIGEYLRMIELKTAVLLGASLQIGAIAGGASRADGEQLYEFGKNLGIAFQLQDDYLDLYAESGKFGKQIGGDILANKKTYLIIKALELAGEEERGRLCDWMNRAGFSPGEKIREVKAIFDALNIPDRIRKETASYIQNAFVHLDAVSVEPGRKEILRAFSANMLSREH